VQSNAGNPSDRASSSVLVLHVIFGDLFPRRITEMELLKVIPDNNFFYSPTRRFSYAKKESRPDFFEKCFDARSGFWSYRECAGGAFSMRQLIDIEAAIISLILKGSVTMMII
jgi:hypothetical protein